MASQYTYLDLRGLVWGRWIGSIDIFEPPLDGRAAQRIAAARLTLAVDHNEFSPQAAQVLLEGITVSVKRGETGEVFFSADFP